MLSRRLVALLLALVALVGIGALDVPPVSAQEDVSWSIEPGGEDGPSSRSAFFYTLKPGQIFQDIVSLSNLTDRPVTFKVYGTDAFNTPADGFFALLDEDEPPVDAGSWITLATDLITIEANTRADIPFQVAIPVDATPGDHVAGIVAQPDLPIEDLDEGSVGVVIRRRQATRMYVRVDGPLEPALQITRLDVAHRSALFPPLTGSGTAAVRYEVRNTGNVRITPFVDLKVEGFFGRTIHTFDRRELPELLPGGFVVTIEAFTGLPPFERLTAKLEVTGVVGPAQPDVVVRAEAGFWVVSWLFVALILAVVVGVAGWWWYRSRRGRRSDVARTPGPDEAETDEGSDVARTPGPDEAEADEG